MRRAASDKGSKLRIRVEMKRSAFEFEGVVTKIDFEPLRFNELMYEVATIRVRRLSVGSESRQTK